MRQSKIITILFTFLLSSCSNFENTFSQDTTDKIDDKIQHEYSEILKLKVSWESIFFLAKPQYFVYFYSPICSHCNAIKNDVIEYGLSHENFYFCEADETHKITQNSEQTIGSKNIENFWISGYPSLCKFESNTCVLNVTGNTSIYVILNL